MTRTSLPQRPLLPGLYHIVRLDADRVLVTNAGRRVLLSGEGIAERAAPLLAALDGRATLEELQVGFPDLVPTVLEGLAARGLLTEAASHPDGPAAAPQHAALALSADCSPAEVAARLARAVVAVAGCGPLGGMVAALLVKAGVGQLVVTDRDVLTGREVAVSPVLSPAFEGRPAAEATRQVCLNAGAGSVETVPSRLAPDLLAQVDLAVIELAYEAGDSPSRDADACLAAGRRYLLHSQDALEAVVGPLVTAGGRPCHRCLHVRELSQQAHLDEHLAYRKHRAEAAPRPEAFLAAHTAVVSGLVATECLRALVGADCATPATSGAALVLDLAALTLRREEILPFPDCPGCDPAARSHEGGIRA